MGRGGNNPTGKNGTNGGEWPPDDVLKASLLDYANRRLDLKERIQALKDDHGVVCGLTKLKKLNKIHNIPNTRNRKAPAEVAQAHVADKMHADTNRRRGPTTVQQAMALEGVHVPRQQVRYHMYRIDPDGSSHRFPGRRNPIPRKPLSAQGTWQQLHGDGHEKLARAALGMGEVSLPIYGYRDQWSGAILLLIVIPDDRHADCIGHLFLDFVEDFKAIAQQFTVDKGSELGVMTRHATVIKSRCAPDIDLEVQPAFIQMKSVHNTPIESFWRFFQDMTGQNLFAAVTYGRDHAIFRPHDQLHIKLFKWLWPPIVQNELNSFAELWNTHKIRKQLTKEMPSGVDPLSLFRHPENYGGDRFSIPVPDGLVSELRKEIATPREEAFRWVTPEFDMWAKFVYEKIGAPELSPGNAWDVFRQMEVELRAQLEIERNSGA